jgi:60 kDa SS-A/Ro ribonucleoprotein
MSRFKSHASKSVAEVAKHEDKRVENFMGGNSYTLNPLDTLRIVAASSIFGEPSYYRDGEGTKSYIRNLSSLRTYSIFGDVMFKDTKSTTDVFTKAIDNSLDYDFKGTLDLALRLRTEFFMRLNPAVIFVRASQHPKRQEFNEQNPGYMREIGNKVILRPDDITNMFEYYMFLNKTKNGLPNIVKRTWADRLSEFTRYQINKYKSKSLIDLVRISHAHSEVIDELMKTGDIEVKETEQTWESLRSQGKSWKEITDTIRIPHMALLRNLRGIFTEVNDLEFTKRILTQLKDGVINGKQFPFRYYTAHREISNTNINHKGLVLDSLEECLDISIQNFPKLDGKTISLSDNSGSAWGGFTSEYGSMTVAEIANLSSIITALRSDEGEVGVFGDRLQVEPPSRRNGILSQLKEFNRIGEQQGGGTENGLWIFFKEAIEKKKHYDNIFIYSDQQAGHGGLYGINSGEYRDYRHDKGSSYYDILKMVTEYRKKVNPKVNIFSVQVAGYDNSVVPENLYRGAILAGWTGKEVVYAKELIEVWDSIENQPKQ